MREDRLTRRLRNDARRRPALLPAAAREEPAMQLAQVEPGPRRFGRRLGRGRLVRLVRAADRHGTSATPEALRPLHHDHPAAAWPRRGPRHLPHDRAAPRRLVRGMDSCHHARCHPRRRRGHGRVAPRDTSHLGAPGASTPPHPMPAPVVSRDRYSLRRRSTPGRSAHRCRAGYRAVLPAASADEPERHLRSVQVSP